MALLLADPCRLIFENVHPDNMVTETSVSRSAVALSIAHLRPVDRRGSLVNKDVVVVCRRTADR